MQLFYFEVKKSEQKFLTEPQDASCFHRMAVAPVY